MRLAVLLLVLAACPDRSEVAEKAAEAKRKMMATRQVVLDLNGHIVISAMSRPTLEDAPGLIEKVRALDPGVVAATPVLLGEAVIAAGGRVAPAVIKGIDTTELDLYIVKGADQSLAGDVIPLHVGHALARQLGVDVGDRVTVVLPLDGSDPTPRSVPARITAILGFGFEEHDRRFAITTLAGARQLFGAGTNVVEVRLHDPGTAPPLAARLRSELGRDYRITDWCELSRALLEALEIPCK